ncbi:hypothetical protein C2845_PM13G08300 [Panicum miliaceum]|uniref:DUF4283 domain-containing protein n=1 Tax=Panicum miliaceum TaxID=4540 RepID=A0A3L6RKM9_PANMI|nr:hypothetical protein C2845_PM13G08300 [Panicum miliaceum]
MASPAVARPQVSPSPDDQAGVWRRHSDDRAGGISPEVAGEFGGGPPARRRLTIAIPGGNQNDFPSLEESIRRRTPKRSQPMGFVERGNNEQNPQFHPNGRRITDWDRKQAKLRQADEIRQSLFTTTAGGVRDEENRDLEELERLARSLDDLLDRVSDCQPPWVSAVGTEEGEPVKKIANGKYEFAVPSKADLNLLMKFTEFQCKSSDLKVYVEKSCYNTGSFEELKQAWVRVLGLPQWARQEKVVEEVAYLIGDPILVDKESLSGRGHVRVKVNCKDPAQINGSNNVFFNGSGFKITWVVEEESAKKDKGGDIFAGVDNDDEEEKSDSYTPFLEEFANPKGKSAGDGGAHSSQSNPQNKKNESQGQHKRDNAVHGMSPKTRSHDTPSRKDILVSQDEEDLGEGAKILPSQKSSNYCNPNDTMEENQFASLLNMEMETQDVSEWLASQHSEVEIDDSLVQILEGGVAAELTNISGPTIATRESKRVKGNDTPIPLHAEKRVAAAHAEGKCGFVLGGNNEEIDRKVSLIKAREEAQAAVALAAQTIAAGADEDTGEDEIEEEGEVFLHDEHIKLVESVLEEDLIPPSDGATMGSQIAERGGTSKPVIV